MNAPAAPADAPAWRFTLGWALLAGGAMFALGVFHNDFPCEYHPDEPSKVAQLIDGTRNYHHPPLMLTLADAAARFGGVPRQPGDLARVGRLLSAAYLAGAVALLTVLAGVYGGTRGSVVTAATALGTNAQTVLAGHFFKEDALFALALALAFVAGAVHWRRRGRWDGLALGAAAGLAVSSKYVGGLAVIYAFALAALAAGEGGRWKGGRMAAALTWCALGIAATVALCNGAALRGHFDTIREGWRLGLSTVQQGNGGVGAQVPHPQFVGMLFVTTPLPVLLGAVMFWAGLRKYPFRAHADRWLAGLSPLWLTAIFSFSASTAVRYFLPVSLLLGCVGGVALPEAVRWAATRWGAGAAFLKRPVPATAAAVGLALLFSLPETVSLLAGFMGDDRAELGRWIAANVPPGAVIAEDALARLSMDAPGQRRVIDAPVVADLGDVAALRAQGIGYVVVCWYDARRYVDPHKRPAPDARDFLRRREFYESLPTHARSLWKSDLRQPFPLRPGLELFALDP